jgi:hypothetical protein
MNTKGVITVDVRDTLALAQTVFDSASKAIGQVTRIEDETGWFTIATGAMYEKQYFLPMTLVKYIDPREVFLTATKEDLKREYSTPPPRTTSIAEEGSATTATTT